VAEVIIKLLVTAIATSVFLRIFLCEWLANVLVDVFVVNISDSLLAKLEAVRAYIYGISL
jgi:hypothetical protein